MQKASTLKAQSSRVSTNKLVKVALLSAISFILMFIEMPIPGLFPDFLKIDISDIPALIAGLALGPIAGIAVEVIKNFLHGIVATTTGGVGELANIVVGSSFVVGSSIVYRSRRNLKGLLMSLVSGTIMMVVVGSIVNYFFLLPFYGKLMGLEAIIGIGKAVNPKVHDLATFVIWFIAPFNFIKGIMISVIIIPIYKKIENLIRAN
ncbi:ECF transporter S component [Peptostreptococcus canis]|uniref:Riboflavin transporter n=1 Tax=Peptostreptococcus canis TaxID=1159213 RepID=A0ABR6TIT9_9FIRM|nr:ECF transporter S component [Peptostreptococcus canis]MBC2575109.1 ECF transporter S component [Peptostreptococcus canis]MBP1997717.1 riboflavin transporter FmnP [Peptostreptococcus canis]